MIRTQKEVYRKIAEKSIILLGRTEAKNFKEIAWASIIKSISDYFKYEME
jgi:hypothetical protein